MLLKIIKINYTSLNYKDILSASGNKGVTKVVPAVHHTMAGVRIDKEN